jgi:hypothetical protein
VCCIGGATRLRSPRKPAWRLPASCGCMGSMLDSVAGEWWSWAALCSCVPLLYICSLRLAPMGGSKGQLCDALGGRAFMLRGVGTTAGARGVRVVYSGARRVLTASHRPHFTLVCDTALRVGKQRSMAGEAAVTGAPHLRGGVHTIGACSCTAAPAAAPTPTRAVAGCAASVGCLQFATVRIAHAQRTCCHTSVSPGRALVNPPHGLCRCMLASSGRVHGGWTNAPHTCCWAEAGEAFAALCFAR